MMHLNDTMPLHKGQHLRLKERIEIQVLKRLGKSHRFIAKQLQRSHSTINDEVKRGTVDQVKLVNGKRIYTHDYYAETGQLIYERHRIVSQAKGKFLKVETFIHYVTKHILEDKWSPDAAVGRFKQEAEHQQEAMVCTKTLYRYIDEGLITNLNNMHLWLKLRRNTKPKRSRERKRILGQSIELRPQEVNERTTFGHWEIDTVIGKKTKGEPVLLTLTERLTRYQLVLKIKAKDEVSVKEAIQSMAQGNPHFAKLFKTVTCDNGSEFASLSDALHNISDVYFTHPYSSWERGTNENHNGPLRRYLPKGKSLKQYSNEQIQRFTQKLNHLPRKILKYLTPTEAILFHFNQIQATN